MGYSGGMPFSLEAIDLSTADEAEGRAVSELFNQLRAEDLPEDPPVPFEEHLARWHNRPDYRRAFDWLVRDEGGKPVGIAESDYDEVPENRHLMWFYIAVLPEFRRQGLGKQLLQRVAEMSEKADRPVWIAETSARIGAGEAFMRRIGAERGLEHKTNQLPIADLDPALLRRWVAEAPAGEFELGLWDGPFPEEDLEAVARLIEVMNTEPRGNLEVEDFRVTPEQLRADERHMAATGGQRWVMYVRERSSGRFAGFTGVYWNPNRPETLSQGGTGVLPEFRGKKLGSWLKAAMLEKVSRDRPQVKQVRTGNADSNAPMLRINHQLGFKPYISRTTWQVSIEKVREYLGSGR